MYSSPEATPLDAILIVQTQIYAFLDYQKPEFMVFNAYVMPVHIQEFQVLQG